MMEGTGRIGIPELAVGVPFPALPLQIMAARLSDGALRDLVYSSRTVQIDEAKAIGLIDEKCPAGMLMDRATEAAELAIASPLLEDVNIEGATGILINITGGPDLTLHEVNEASSLIQQAAHEDANIIFGSVIDPNLSEEVRITVIATGFDRPAKAQAVVPSTDLPA